MSKGGSGVECRDGTSRRRFGAADLSAFIRGVLICGVHFRTDCGRKGTPVCPSFRVRLEGQSSAQLDDALGTRG